MSVAPGPTQTCSEGCLVAHKYRLESLLGEGGMGSVWRAFNLQLEVPVAIKLLRTDLAATDLGERLRVEARAVAKLVHPSIVRVFDIGESESGDPFIVMELLTGESLGTLLERGALSAVSALRLLLPIAEGLSLAHSRGVVHRDIKPDNIFIAHEGSMIQPKLLDFGIAKVTSSALAGGPSLTLTGTLIGSPDYMSPEQAYGQADVDERSDIWAFCVVLYEMLAGCAPFRGDSAGSVLRSVVQDEPQALETLANVDPALSAIVRRGLEKDRDARPSSIFELGRELACWLVTQGVLEDATGASLEAKWLGRRHADDDSAWPATVAPRAQHEHATLVSVVHRSTPPSSQPLTIPGLRRGPRLPVALAGGIAVIAAVWLTLVPVRPASLPPAASLPAPRAIAATIARAAVQPEPGPVVLVADLPQAEPEPQLVARPKASANPRRPAASRIPVALTLPRALPAETPPAAREKQPDLMSPY